MKLTPLLLAVLLLPASILALRAETVPGAAARFIAAHGDVWFNFWADDRVENYPFGYSNKKINDELSRHMDPAQGRSINSTLTNKHYLFEGDWYTVEWFYAATDKVNGRRQRESTLAFGHVKKDRLDNWREFFDDRIGQRQQGFYPGSLPLFRESDVPSPWPPQAKLKLKYRP